MSCATRDQFSEQTSDCKNKYKEVNPSGKSKKLLPIIAWPYFIIKLYIIVHKHFSAAKLVNALQVNGFLCDLPQAIATDAFLMLTIPKGAKRQFLS